MLRFSFFHASTACVLFATVITSSQAVPVTFDLQTATLQDVQKAMDAGAISSVEMTNLYLARIAAYDDKNSTTGPKLNSIAVINPNALQEAAAADARRANGESGPILGVPFIVKHSYAVQGLALTGGESNWTTLIAPADAPAVALLRAAGGVFLGYGNMSTFAISATTSTSEDAGTTRNAYVSGYAAGGSSGGPGVATGASFSFFAFAGETGGSIRNPSERSGIVGFKPSVGVVPISDVLALVPNRDVIGPMTRHTADSAAIMDIVAKRDPQDIWYPIFPLLAKTTAFPSGYTAKLNNFSLAGKRIGYIGNYIGKTHPSAVSGSNFSAQTTTTTEILGIFNQARTALENLGATTVEVYLTSDVDSEATQASGAPRRMLYTSPYIDQSKAYAHRTLLEWLTQTPDDNDETLRAKVMLWAGRNNNISSTITTIINNATDISFQSELAREHFRATRNILDKYDAWMAANNLDFLIWPTAGSKSSTSQTYAGNDLVNYLGMPLVTVPMGVLSTGEPNTLAFSGRIYDDANVLAAAHAYEQATNKRINPTTLAPALSGETFTYESPDIAARSTSPDSSSTLESSTNDSIEGVVHTVAVKQRAETIAPLVSILGAAKVQAGKGRQMLIFKGNALDASGIRRLQVTVNGKKTPVKIASNWKAATSANSFRTLVRKGQDAVRVVVFAEDTYGNTAATSKMVRLPIARLATD